MSRYCKVVGHRGMPSRYPENTIPSFLGAIAAGVDALEFDVHLTADRRLVVVHDDTVERCSNGVGAVRDLTFDQLRALDFGSWKSGEFAGLRIPAFDEVLDAILGHSDSVELLIELKEDDEECAVMVLEELRRRALLPRCTVLSFYANLLKLLHELEPQLRLQGFRLEDFQRREEDVYHYLHRLCIWRNALTVEQIDRFHQLGIEVDVCPVDNAAQLEQVLPFEVDTVTTNAADVLMPLLAARKLRPPRLPEYAAAWRLYGAGLEELRRDLLPLPEPGPEEILVRIDAVGLCFSDIKIIRAGAAHPKLWWNNLAEHPLIPGHEAVFTLMKTGSAVPLTYAAGQRFLIQCDIYLGGRSCAFGYGMDGAYACYGLIDARVWRGERCSYLLPFPERLSAVGTALIEPWSCVRGAYHLTYRTAPVSGGRLLLVGEPGDTTVYCAGELFRSAGFSAVEAVDWSAEAVAALSRELDFPVRRLTSLPATGEYDDIVCCNLSDPLRLERAAALAARHGIVNFYGRVPAAGCRIDVGALHYQHRYYQGAASGEFSALYRAARRSDLKPGGAVWFPGGAGAMGQMHVELALRPGGPSRILVSDLDDRRIGKLAERLRPRAAALGVTLRFLNPAQLGEEAFDRELRAFAPAGFDDVIVLVPSAAIVEHAAGFLAAGALVNLFAGIPAGVAASLPMADLVSRQVRFVGSSGSTFDDMRETLAAAVNGEFKPQAALAAIGGMEALKEGLTAVAAGRFPGKTAILPDCPMLPLTAISELGKLDPSLPSTLDDEGCYTPETERRLRELWGGR